MATTKYTQTGQDWRLEQLSTLRERRKDLSELEGLKISPEWAKLVKVLREFAKFSRREEQIALRDHDSGDLEPQELSRLITKARQKASDFDLVCDLLEKTKAQLETVDAEIARLEHAFSQAKEALI